MARQPLVHPMRGGQQPVVFTKAADQLQADGQPWLPVVNDKCMPDSLIATTYSREKV